MSHTPSRTPAGSLAHLGKKRRVEDSASLIDFYSLWSGDLSKLSTEIVGRLDEWMEILELMCLSLAMLLVSVLVKSSAMGP